LSKQLFLGKILPKMRFPEVRDAEKTSYTEGSSFFIYLRLFISIVYKCCLKKLTIQFYLEKTVSNNKKTVVPLSKGITVF
jgi:hypothetical protein